MHEDGTKQVGKWWTASKNKADGRPDRRPPSTIEPNVNPLTSRSLECGVAILESFSEEHKVLGISEIADILGVSRSTVHRYAITLVALGYLEQDNQRKYRLSIRAAGPGCTVVGMVRRQVPARVALEDLRDEIGYTVSMGVLDGPRVVYVHRLFGHRRGQYAVDMDLGVGATIPLYCTAMGKVLLASLSKAERREIFRELQLVRYGPKSITTKKALAAELARLDARAVIVSDEEFAVSSRSVAVGVPHPASRYLLAMDVTVPSSAYPVEVLLRDVALRLKHTARLISGNHDDV